MKEKVLQKISSKPHKQNVDFFLGTEPKLGKSGEITYNARRILQSNYKTILAFHNARNAVLPKNASLVESEDGEKDIKIKRIAGRIDESIQDILRGELVFAAAGLDAIIKQLIRDGVANYLQESDVAKKAFGAFVHSTIVDKDKNEINPKVIAYSLAIGNSQKFFVQKLVERIERTSMQSLKQFFSHLEYLGVTSEDVKSKILTGCLVDDLKNIFEVRHQIIHEMDTDLATSKNTRRRRSTEDLQKYTKTLYDISLSVILFLEKK